MARTLILGGGFGGITVATGLRRLLGDGHEVMLVDRSEGFSMGLRKLWEMVGESTIAEGTRSRTLLADKGIEFVQRPVSEIDPHTRSARVGDETIGADFLVVALGAEGRPDLVPGLDEHALDVWSRERVPVARQALERFDGGRIAVVIAGGPYPCPPAPFECALLLDEWLRGRGLRDATELSVTSFQPMLLPNAGRLGSKWVGEQLDARGIGWATGRKVERVEPGQVVFEDGELDAELVIGVAPHRAPAVVADSALAGKGGWVWPDPGTLETGHDGVWAIGDVTFIELANNLPLPKAGVMAELQGRRVAGAIAAAAGEGEEPPPFDGHGFCFLELGLGEAAMVEGDFYGDPEPQVVVKEPSPERADEKRRFEAERLEAWFGS